MLVGVLLIAVVPQVVTGGATAVLGFIVGLVAVMLVTWPLLVVHELGHAIVGTAMGEKLIGIRFGVGRRVVKFELRDVRIEFGLVPFGGATDFVNRGRSTFRPPILLAGVAFEAVVGLAAWRWSSDGAITGLIRYLVLVTVVLHVVTNLWPFTRTNGAWESSRTDGGHLLQWLRSDDDMNAPIGDIDARGRAAAVVHRLNRKDYAGALERAQAGYAQQPDSLDASHALGAALLFTERWGEAYQVLAQVADRAELLDPDSPYHAVVPSNAAWAAVMASDPDLLANADRWSRAAYLRVPVEPAVSATRGSVLVMLGRYGEAMPLLERSLRNLVSDSDKAIAAGFLAVAAARSGHPDAAREHEAAMLRLDPACPVRAFVEQSVAVALPWPPPAVSTLVAAT